MKKRVAAVVAAVLLLALGGAFYVLAYTQTGIELLVAQLNRLERLGIHAEGVSGRITGPLRIARFELDHERAHIVVEDIVIDLKLRWLALQTLDINALTATSANIELKTAPDEPPPDTPPRFLPGFLRVAVTKAEIGSITLTTVGGQSITTTSASTALRLRSDRLWLDGLDVVAPLFTVQGDLELRAARPLGLKFSGTGTVADGDRPDLDIAAEADGTVEALRFSADLLAPSQAHVEGRFVRADDPWQVEGRVTSAAFSLDPWMERPPFSLAAVQLDFSARPEVFRITGQLAAPELDPAPFDLDASGRYVDRTMIISAATLAQTSGPARLRAEGRLAFDGGPPALNIAGEWTAVQWPLTAARPVVTSPSGRLTLSGPLPYQFSLSADVAGPSLPAARGLLTGSLSREALRVQRYDITALEGSLAGDASLTFGTPLRWAVNTTATDINPVSLHAEFPGQMDFTATAAGSGLDREAAFDVSLSRLQGRLRGLPLNGSGRVERAGSEWRIRDTTLAMGEARLTAAGTISDQVDLDWTFSARALEDLLPEVQGGLSFNGNASGPRQTPRVVADIDGRSLQYAGWTVGAVAIDADVDLAGIAPSQLAATLSNVRNGALHAEALRLSGQGNAETHALTLHVASRTDGGTASDAELEITGALADGVWTGQIASGQVANTDDRRNVRLSEPATAVVSRDHATVERLCLFLLGSNICGNGSWQRGGAWQVDATGDDLPLDVIRLAFPSQPRYLGTLDLTLAASGAGQSPWEGSASVVLTGGGIVYQLSSDSADATETVQFGSGRADLHANGDSLQATIGLAATAETFIAANATAMRLPGVALGNLPVTGRIRARMGDANLLPLLVAEIDDAAGVLDADVALSGRISQPELDGRIALSNGALDLYRINLALREMEIDVNLSANRFGFEGTGRAGDGTWSLGGTLAWRNGLPAGTLDLKGENLLVADLPDYRVVAAPDLHFLIDGRKIDASGEVFIPSARIQPTDLSGAVQVSPDSRLVQDEPAETASSFFVNSEIRIRLGDDVQLDTFGLQGRLGGSVGTTTRTGDIPVGRGELSVSSGKYEAYGQSLDITRGRLLFDASPLDDPGLDIQAERTIETTKVGLNVRGTLRDPRFGFYSEPSMSQTQILSYLLVGKPIDDLQNRDADTVGSARDTLALQGGGILAAQLGRRLGLGEIGVESTGANDTALVLGRFLSPRLFVSYGISLTESINTLKLRYTISDRWVLKTEAGENQSADVEFTIERP